MSDRCSIVIPVYNKAGLTGKCLDTLFADQPSVDFEIVVVDDASTDSTAELLAEYAGSVEVVRHEENAGFAAACNDGAAASGGNYLVFLNNDTVPQPGWLDALVEYARTHPGAAVVGSKLIFPNDTIQHAGVVFCRQGRPRHIYAGFPADHPAVNRSRRFQAVTFACALVRRAAFDQAGGFEPAFRNDLEDVDLCLRLGELGHEVHYCADSVLYHLESVSRGRQLPKESARLYLDRWSGRVSADDLSYYVEDGLLELRYREPYPIGMAISPRLAVIDRPEGDAHLLQALSGQVLDLLRETARLTARVADLELRGAPSDDLPAVPEAEGAKAPLSPGELQRRAREIELEVHELQSALSAAVRDQRPADDNDLFEPGDYLDYRKLLTEVREAVASNLPAESVVLVVSRGDEELLGLDGRQGWHFPRTDDGGHPGHNPPDSGWAISHLEQLRAKGAEYLLIPRTELWWLDHYAGFASHLERRYRIVARDDVCTIFSLGPE